MKNIADRINDLITELHIPKNTFAAQIGISSSLISQITTKKNNFRVDILQKITSKYPSLNSEWLLNGIGEMWQESHPDEVLNKRLLKASEHKVEEMKNGVIKSAENRTPHQLSSNTELTHRQWLILQKNREKAQRYFKNNESNITGLLQSIEDFIYFPHMANVIIDQYFSKLSDIIYINDSNYLNGENFDFSKYIADIEIELKQLQHFAPALEHFGVSISKFYDEFNWVDPNKILDNI